MSEGVVVQGGEVSTLDLAAALDQLEALQRLKAAVDAREQRLLARVDALDEAEHPGVRWDRESVSAILRCAPVTTRGRLGQATQLVTTLPLTLAALETGQITPMHARVMLEASSVLDTPLTARLERRVLHRAQTASVSEFRACCAKAVLTLDPAGAEQRHQHAAQDRTLTFRPNINGMADIHAHVTAAQAARVRQHLDACTDTILAPTATDPVEDPVENRSRDAVRADVFCDLLTANTGGTPGGHGDRPIHVTVAMSTLLGHDDLPGELDGEPVAASIIRQLAHDPNAWWRPVLIDRDGHLEAIGARHYRPSTPLRHMVELHDRRCQFPGCRRRAARCEIDHAVAFDHTDPLSGGLTVFDNLHCLCKRHHRLKHETGWTIVRKDGNTSWRSPQGRRYDKHFDPYLDPAEPQPPGSDDPPPY